LDDTNGNVNDASAKNVDAIIPEVPQIDTNENVNEASAQISDAIIEEKPQDSCFSSTFSFVLPILVGIRRAES
jgi:tRNA A37 threonylcarbamoyltransferase TsaD